MGFEFLYSFWIFNLYWKYIVFMIQKFRLLWQWIFFSNLMWNAQKLPPMTLNYLKLCKITARHSKFSQNDQNLLMIARFFSIFRIKNHKELNIDRFWSTVCWQKDYVRHWIINQIYPKLHENFLEILKVTLNHPIITHWTVIK